MNLYLVRNDSGDAIWLAHEDDELRIWTYVQNTGKFHLNQGLYRDFYFDHANSYEPITAEAALQVISDGVGRLNERVVGHIVDRFKADPAARSIEEVLGSTPIPSTRQQAASRVRALKVAPKGEWMTWGTYDKARRSAAYVAASSLRLGKVAALRELGPVDARVENVDDKVEVRVARKA